MKIFKFGGASVKDAESVKNVTLVLKSQGFERCLLVVSAMGKTTNALEKAVHLYFENNDYSSEIETIKQHHLGIASELFQLNHSVFEEIEVFFNDIISFLSRNKSPNYNFVYDQVVSCGEMISSKILSNYLNENGYTNQWLDARDFIKTDNNYREGTVNWETTGSNISKLNKTQNYLTQGFIGSDEHNFTVTLGREGSDYSAAVFAYALDAEEMTIWKDVPGVMTGDPRKFENTSLLSRISYEEAIEMAYYGASVIHPKTLQPLKQKNIPFFVKSFLEPEKPGTQISNSEYYDRKASYILKENQILLNIATRDFSFIAEEHLSLIFKLMAKYKIKISLMQNSAISLALCIEDKYQQIEELIKELETIFNCTIQKNVSLFTVRNFDMETIKDFYAGKNIVLEQSSNRAVQIVTH